MIVYTAALRLGGRVVDRPCDVMKRQFVLLSLPLCIPSFRDTYVVFPYKRGSFSSPQLRVFSHRFWSYPQTDSREKRERRGGTISPTSESEPFQSGKSCQSNFIASGFMFQGVNITAYKRECCCDAVNS